MQNGPENTELNQAISENPSNETGGKKSTLEELKIEPMAIPTLVKRLIQNKENGEVEVVLALTNEQLGGFINVALLVLLQAGMLSFQDQVQQAQMKNYLEQVDAKDLPQV